MSLSVNVTNMSIKVGSSMIKLSTRRIIFQIKSKWNSPFLIYSISLIIPNSKEQLHIIKSIPKSQYIILHKWLFNINLSPSLSKDRLLTKISLSLIRFRALTIRCKMLIFLKMRHSLVNLGILRYFWYKHSNTLDTECKRRRFVPLKCYQDSPGGVHQGKITFIIAQRTIVGNDFSLSALFYRSTFTAIISYYLIKYFTTFKR